MDIVNFDALKAQGKVLPVADVDLTEDYFIIGKRNVHYTTNSQKATEYPVFAIKAGDVMGANTKYKVYTALLTQSGITAPVATVLENTLGVIPIWNYDAAGSYYLESTGTFTTNKTTVTAGPLEAGSLGAYVQSRIISQNQVFIVINKIDGTATNDSLSNTLVEIRVYN